MRQGIAENFIGVLRNEDRANRRSLVRHGLLLALLFLITGLAVDLASDGRFFGVGMAVVTIATLAGAALGLVAGRGITLRRWNQSLARTWNQWMRYSVACARIDEVDRRVRQRPATRNVGWLVTLWTIVLFATLILLLFTVVDGAPTVDKTPVFAGYGVYLGFALGRAIAVNVWVRQFLASVDELMRDGEIAVWGVV